MLAKELVKTGVAVLYRRKAALVRLLKRRERVLAIYHGPELRARVGFDLTNPVPVLGIFGEELAHAWQDVVVVLRRGKKHVANRE